MNSTSTNHSNGTSSVLSKCEEFFHYQHDAEFVAAIIILVLGFSGNVVTVAVISCWKKLHTPTFTMIACLAVSDAYSLLQHFFWHYTIFENDDISYFCTKLHRNGYTLLRNLTIFIGRLNAGFQLCLLASLRYIAVVHPLKFKTCCSPKKVIIGSLCGWIIVLLFSIFCTFSLIFWRHIFNSWKQSWDFRVSVSFLNFIIPTLLFIILHFLKMRALRRSPVLNNSTSRKMSIVIFIIILIYAASTASIGLAQLEINFFGNINTIAFMISCSINPFIYFVSSAPMVRIFRRISSFRGGSMSSGNTTTATAL